MSKRLKVDTVILAAALFLTTGAVLFYNIKSSDGGSISVSLSDLLEGDSTSASLVSECAAAHLSEEKSVYTSAAADAVNPFDHLLPPIVTPPTE